MNVFGRGMRWQILLGTLCLVAGWSSGAWGQTQEVRLVTGTDLSPDGATIAFSWRGDLWTVGSGGGTAKRFTSHDARDRNPRFSPDGNEIAFVSEREGAPQVFVAPRKGGAARQLTYHTSGCDLEGWYPDGQSLLIHGQRDHYWRHAERLMKVSRSQRGPERVLFDDYGADGVVSPDGKQLLFTREGPSWWRKGYRGSQAAQIWLYQFDDHSFRQLAASDGGVRWPLWKPDGKGFYFVGGNPNSQNLFEFDLASGEQKQLTRFEDDSVVFPCVSRDGSTIVFRHLFDLYRYRPGKDKSPKKLSIKVADDDMPETIERRTLAQATQVAFSRDGLEIVFAAGGDLWVMDTELREPRQITNTPEEERDPIFAPDGQTLWYVSDAGGQTDLWRAQRASNDKYWWLNESFTLTQVTNDADIESDPRFSPDGSRVAYVRGLGQLWYMKSDGQDAKQLLASWNAPDFDWSPDGKWMAYAQFDDDFNRDIWIVPIDGSQKPINVSRHPDNDGNPTWSPDGKLLAFTGRRGDDEVDILYVWLQAADDDTSRRDRSLQKAIDKMKKGRSRGASGGSSSGSTSGSSSSEKPSSKGDGESGKPEGGRTEGTRSEANRTPPKVVVELEGLHDRIHRVSISDSTESGLFWSPDSKKLAFTGSVEGKRGTYYIEIPEDTRPKSLIAQTGSQARWLEAGNQVVWLSQGAPGSVSATGQATSYRVSARQTVDRPAKFAAVFDQCWRTMRDRYYDERLGNKNWDAVRRKYRDMASASPDTETLTTVVNLMLGELNGSHLGFRMQGDEPSPNEPPAAPAPGAPNPGTPAPGTPEPPTASVPTRGGKWQVSTAHFGLRFVDDFAGPGLKVRDVISGTPAARKATRIEPGEIVLSIDRKAVDPAMDLTELLNGPSDRDVLLRVKNAAGQERDVTLRPISFSEVRRLIYDKWVKDNQKKVDELSQGRFGYLHINGMNMPNFYKFEEELYAVGAGKEGLVIDVRENPGGSTTDHLLTALLQPDHAITVPRGGGPGYPQDRVVYATWRKPIVVLCNQNSFSNAEIFSHAVKTLERGKVVGVPTAGGVISTGATTIMDVGTLRLPFRGWYLLKTGEDMELHGAVPDVIVWPAPGELPAGKDTQLSKAIEVLNQDVTTWKQRPRPQLKKAMER